jgi:ketosteroid isomerase-like protein
MPHLPRIAVAALLLAIVTTLARAEPAPAELRRQVEDTERAFAQTMADRDYGAFAAFLSEEAIFFGGGEPLRGKQQVAAAWKGYFEKADAPFSWAPEVVEVLPSGALAHSSGPVFNPAGERIATFNSVWRLDADGRWRIVFDKGSRDCPPRGPAEEQ